MTNVNTIDFSKKLSYEEEKDIYLSSDYFELSKNGNIVLVGSSPYQVLHRSRAIELGIAEGKKGDDFISSQYILKPANLLLEVPMIDIKRNYECLHSFKDINDFYDKEIKEVEEKLETVRRRKANAIEYAEKYKLPLENPIGFTRDTDASKVFKERDNQITYKKDGNQFCATTKDFINLQESPAGFGNTKEKAKKQLLAKYRMK